MGIHVTKYETKNGKTRKVKNEKNEAPGTAPAADKNQTAGNSGNKGV